MNNKEIATIALNALQTQKAQLDAQITSLKLIVNNGEAVVEPVKRGGRPKKVATATPAAAPAATPAPVVVAAPSAPAPEAAPKVLQPGEEKPKRKYTKKADAAPAAAPAPQLVPPPAAAPVAAAPAENGEKKGKKSWSPEAKEKARERMKNFWADRKAASA